MKHLLYILVIATFKQITSISIVEKRYKNLYNPNARCLFMSPAQAAHLNDPEASVPIQIKALFTMFSTSMKRIPLNCSMVYVKYSTPGKPNENGSYDGLIGIVQRDEVDLAWFLIRPDSLPFEPVKFTPPATSADIVIISRKNSSLPVTHELTHFLAFDGIIYVYILITIMFIFSIIYIWVEAFVEENTFDLKKKFIEYIETNIKIIQLFIGQDDLSPNTVTGIVLAFSVCLFIQIFIYGILMSTVGADLVVQITPPRIESLDDLLNSEITPVIFKKLFLLNILKASPSSGKMNKLFDKIMKNPNESLFDINVNDVSEMMPRFLSLAAEIDQSKKAIMIPNSVVETFMIFGCTLFPQKVENTHAGYDLFAAGTLSGVMSKKIDPYLEKVLQFQTRNTLELGVVVGGIKTFKSDLHQSFPQLERRYDVAMIKCVEGIIDAEETVFSPFSLKDFSSLFICYFFICFVIFVISSIKFCYSELK